MTSMLQCLDCKHLDRAALPDGIYRCAAFPDAIPWQIKYSEHDHHEPFPGDRGILFEPIEGAKETPKP